jgi:hypothetical protein
MRIERRNNMAKKTTQPATNDHAKLTSIRS